MAEHDWLDTSPFFFEGGPVGCLMIHGFTGAPAEMRPMGEYLARMHFRTMERPAYAVRETTEPKAFP